MANPDRPRGFTPVKMLSGAPWAGNVRSVGVTAGANLYLGDLLILVGGLAAVGASASTAFLGVAVGFGKRDPASGQFAGAYNPDDLTKLFYDDSASTAADWRVFYVPVEDMVFEVQSSTDLDLVIGGAADLLPAAGSQVTGRSAHEITTAANSDVTVIEIPAYQDNDSTLANTRYWVSVPRTNQVNN